MLPHSSERVDSAAVTCTLLLEADLLPLRSVQTCFCRLSNVKECQGKKYCRDWGTVFYSTRWWSWKEASFAISECNSSQIKEYCSFCNPAWEAQEPILINCYTIWKLLFFFPSFFNDRLLKLVNGKWQTLMQPPHILHNPNYKSVFSCKSSFFPLSFKYAAWSYNYIQIGAN